MHQYKNLPLHNNSVCIFSFCRKEIFPWERGNISNWGNFPSIITPWASFAGGDPSKIHRNKKREFFNQEGGGVF
jgi:hypothetical protein